MSDQADQNKPNTTEEVKAPANSRPSGGLSRRGARGGSSKMGSAGPVYRKKET